MDKILRLPAVKDITGRGTTALYGDIGRGVMTKPVEIGPNAKGWPASEVEALINARIAGWSEDQVRALVNELHAKRAQAVGPETAQVEASPFFTSAVRPP